MLKIEMTLPAGFCREDIIGIITSSLPIVSSEISHYEMIKKTLFLRDGEVFYRLSVGFQVSDEREAYLLRFKKKVEKAESYTFEIPTVPNGAFPLRPIVIGAGPCGLFAALLLAEAGASPLVLERGMPVEERKKSVLSFYGGGTLDPESNVQFGEGGAGAFSDGKLKCGAMDAYKRKVLDTFISVGAPEEIRYSSDAHLGTDKLPEYVKSIRERILSLGGEIRYQTKFVDYIEKDGKLTGILAECRGKQERIEADTVILATGHSARDVYRTLLSRHIPMEAKGFGIGMRVEHPREYINRLFYGNEHIADIAGTASYHLVTHLENGRSVYSFCNCPGGTVVAAASESCGIVTNGMSEYARDAENSNAAHLVSVTPEDFGSDSPLAGIALQEKIEHSAYSAAGNSYCAPAIRMDDFLSCGKPISPFTDVLPSYPCGTSKAEVNSFLPQFITDSLRKGISEFDSWKSGFYNPSAVLTGPETRSTAPVKILRSPETYSTVVSGLYPAGEGAGYSGGIVSSAVDGLHVASAILKSRCKKSV